MSDAPITVSVPLSILREIRDTMQECSEDLLTELTTRSPVPRGPTDARRFDRDAEVVYRAQRLVQALDGQPWAYGDNWRVRSR